MLKKLGKTKFIKSEANEPFEVQHYAGPVTPRLAATTYESCGL